MKWQELEIPSLSARDAASPSPDISTKPSAVGNAARLSRYRHLVYATRYGLIASFEMWQLMSRMGLTTPEPRPLMNRVSER